MSQRCRFCDSSLHLTFCNLEKTPPSNSYLKSLDQTEHFFPLHAYVCEKCFLVQLGQFQTPDDIFSDYAYFSSYSDSWIEHGKRYTEKVINRFHLNSESSVVEIASNDGYLLQHFKERKIPVIGIEPAKNVAEVAIKKGISTLNEFFGKESALRFVQKNQKADLMIANNVLAHVPDLNDFIAGFKILLSPNGVITFEFPHLLQLIDQNQFDTIYHEHFSYFSLFCVEKIFKHHNLEIFDVEEIPTHGGSLRLYVQHAGGGRKIEDRVDKLKEKEASFGLLDLNTYTHFDQKIASLRESIRSFFDKAKQENKSVVGYGAPAKGNTLLNFCKINPSMLPFTVDRSPHKQGHFLPGTHIPILSLLEIEKKKPDYLFILPWNLKREIMDQMSCIRSWGGKFVVPIPEVIVI